jgi:hypothetical protein
MSTPIESLVESLAIKLWGLAAAKVEVRIEAELAAVQRDLLAEARQLRELGTELGNAVADRLEATNKRITREWAVMEQSLCSQPLLARQGGRRFANGAVPAEPNLARRSRGRPRKNSLSDPTGMAQETTANPSGMRDKEPLP